MKQSDPIALENISILRSARTAAKYENAILLIGAVLIGMIISTADNPETTTPTCTNDIKLEEIVVNDLIRNPKTQ